MSHLREGVPEGGGGGNKEMFKGYVNRCEWVRQGATMGLRGGVIIACRVREGVMYHLHMLLVLGHGEQFGLSVCEQCSVLLLQGV